MAAPEVGLCYERAESLAHSLNCPKTLQLALVGQWRHSLMADRLSATLQIAKRLCTLAQEQNDTLLLIGAYGALACTLYCLGDIETCGQYAMLGLQLWRSLGAQSSVVELDADAVSLLCYEAQFELQIGEFVTSQRTMAEAISLANELNDMHGLASALGSAANLGQCERNLAEVERFSSDLIEDGAVWWEGRGLVGPRASWAGAAVRLSAGFGSDSENRPPCVEAVLPTRSEVEQKASLRN